MGACSSSHVNHDAVVTAKSSTPFIAINSVDSVDSCLYSLSVPIELRRIVLSYFSIALDNTSIREALELWLSKYPHERHLAMLMCGTHMSHWKTTGVSDMSNLFNGQENFNDPIDDWDVSNVTDMRYMFGNTVRFNQPLDSWDVNNVTDMTGMFSKTMAFNQPLYESDVCRCSSL